MIKASVFLFKIECSSLPSPKPVSNCKTSFPTENAPCENPGRLEFIVSVY